MIQFLKALADETRLKILMILREGEFSVQEITQILSMGQSRISRHLRILTEAGIAEYRREGSWVFYRFRPSERRYRGICDQIADQLDETGSYEGLRGLISDVLEGRRSRSLMFFSREEDEWRSLHDRSIDRVKYFEELKGLLGSAGVLADLGCGTGWRGSLRMRDFPL